MSIASKRVRWPLHAVTSRLPFYFDTCRWLCEPLKKSVCIYPPACSAPFVMVELHKRLAESGFFDCDHKNRRPNSKATAIRPPDVAEICIDCGTGIVTLARERPEGEIW